MVYLLYHMKTDLLYGVFSSLQKAEAYVRVDKWSESTGWHRWYGYVGINCTHYIEARMVDHPDWGIQQHKCN